MMPRSRCSPPASTDALIPITWMQMDTTITYDHDTSYPYSWMTSAATA